MLCLREREIDCVHTTHPSTYRASTPPQNNTNANSVRVEVFHPYRHMIQLQTTDPLRLLTALRTWVSIAYLGTPPAFVGIRMRIPPELAPPLPPIKVGRRCINKHI